MTKPLLIGISGKKRHGKDSLCTSLQLRLKESIRLAFADPLREEVALALGVTVEHIDNNKYLFREMLQAWGCLRRKFDESYWIEQLDEEWNFPLAARKIIVIPDVRFQNELDYIKSNGGITIRINRPGFDSSDSHVSETELDGATFDYYFDCVTMDDIDKAAESLVNQLKAKGLL